jgi:DNA-binding MarR family transcriptional regulator
MGAEATRRDAEEAEIVLRLLDVVERDSAVTQRSAARELGIALGLANAYLKRCVRKGLIKVSQAPTRRYAYYLTPKGFSEKSRLTAEYLSHSFSFFRKARKQCADLFSALAAAGQHRVLLIGGGDLAEIAQLVAREYPGRIGVALERSDPRSLSCCERHRHHGDAAAAADRRPRGGVLRRRASR